MKPIRDYYKGFGDGDIIQYVGIASDEQIRLDRLKSNQVSLLDKYGYTEKMAHGLSRDSGLLSPIYEKNSRGGCWFCPNARERVCVCGKRCAEKGV